MYINIVYGAAHAISPNPSRGTPSSERPVFFQFSRQLHTHRPLLHRNVSRYYYPSHTSRLFQTKSHSLGFIFISRGRGGGGGEVVRDDWLPCERHRDNGVVHEDQPPQQPRSLSVCFLSGRHVHLAWRMTSDLLKTQNTSVDVFSVHIMKRVP